MELSNGIDLIRESLKIFFEKKNSVYLFKIYSVALIPSLMPYVFAMLVARNGGNGQSLYLILLAIITIPISLWVGASGLEAVKRVIGGGLFDFRDTYKASWKYLWRLLLTGILTGIIFTGGFLLLIIPGIIFWVWYSFTPWMVVDKGFGVIQSLKESKALVKGRFWKVFGRIVVITIFAVVIEFGLSSIPVVGSLTATMFGGLFLLPGYLLYKELQKDLTI